MPLFYNNESTSLEKCVDIQSRISELNIEYQFETDTCIQWIKANDFKKVCLQFPDHLLQYASRVVLEIQQHLQQVYVLGDTSYESCCIDYKTASHVNADAIIHFGPTCDSATTGNIPYLNIYEKYPLSSETFREALTCINKETRCLILTDDPYVYAIGELQSALKEYSNLVVSSIHAQDKKFEADVVVYIGGNSKRLLNVKLSLSDNVDLFWYNPLESKPTLLKYEMNSKVLKRRYYLIEKIKDSTTVGIVVGTLAVQNYMQLIQRIKELLQLHKKKYYIISVGKPTVAKLANFPEINVFVVVSCAMSEIYENKDFYQPIVTPFDLEVALNPDSANLKFSYDYNKYLSETKEINKDEVISARNTSDVSLLTGNTRVYNESETNTEIVNDETAVAVKSDGTVSVKGTYGAGYLAERTWKGLEQNLGQTEVTVAEEGRKGLAYGYENEVS